MENFATRREGIGVEEQTDRRIYSDRSSECLFSVEDTARLLLFSCVPVILPSTLVWMIKQGAFEKRPLLCRASSSFCNVRLYGGEPALDWLTHLTRLEDETYPSVCVQRIQLNVECHDWYSSTLEVCVQSGVSSVLSQSHFSVPCDALPCSICCAEPAHISLF